MQSWPAGRTSWARGVESRPRDVEVRSWAPDGCWCSLARLSFPEMRARRVARRAAQRLGLDIRPFLWMLDPASRIVRLCERHGVTALIDAGANDGEWAAELRAKGYRGRLLSFEPQSAVFAKLAARASADPLWEARQLALGRAEGHMELLVSSDSRWSSVLPLQMTNEQSVVVGQETVKVSPLDSAVESLVTEADRVFLKLDVQGYELEVLAGARESLPQVVMAQAEVTIADVYAGQPSSRELIAAFEDAGFRLIGVEGGDIASDGEQGYFDALFARREPDSR